MRSASTIARGRGLLQSLLAAGTLLTVAPGCSSLIPVQASERSTVGFSCRKDGPVYDMLAAAALLGIATAMLVEATTCEGHCAQAASCVGLYGFAGGGVTLSAARGWGEYARCQSVRAELLRQTPADDWTLGPGGAPPGWRPAR